MEKNQQMELAKLRGEVDKCSAAFTVSVTSTDDLLRLISLLKDDLLVLGGPVETVRKRLPSLDHLTTSMF